MTFKEKWELEHPGEKFSFTGHGTESWRFPYKCGYEKIDADSAHCEMGIDIARCPDCTARLKTYERALRELRDHKNGGNHVGV